MNTSYLTALYIRLSREDGDGGDSNSVKNQRDLLRAYVKNDPDIGTVQEFVDDGYTGTDLNRPAFADMMRKIDGGVVRCVVVKDLSRLGRNYIELGRLTEITFPQKRVRFIAVNDGIDTLRSPQTSSSILVPFKNLLNDEYSRDISTKIRSALDIRRKNGVFIGSFPSYGYKKDPTDPSRLVIDEDAAEVVRRIFALYTAGTGKHTIARLLNAEGVPSPAAYKAKVSPTYRPPNGGSASLWSFSAVDRILKNRIYLGELVQGKTKMLSHRIHTPIRQDEADWIVVPNTHAPIISKDQFLLAAKQDKVQTKTDRTGTVHPLSGLVRCGACGRSLNRRTVTQKYGVYHYYFCPTYRQSKDACTKHTVRVETVERAVLGAIRQELTRAADLASLYNTYKNRTIPSGSGPRRNAILRDIETAKTLKRGIYEDWKAGDLTREEYNEYKIVYTERISALEQRLSALTDDSPAENPWLSRLAALKHPEQLDRELTLALIDRIEVHSESHLRIFFKFSDALADMETQLKQLAT